MTGPSRPEPSAPLLVVVGSSNTAGMGASTYKGDPTSHNGWQSPATSWIGLLAARCAGLPMVNLSVSGANSTWALQRSKEACLSFAPRYLFFGPNPIADHDDGGTYIRNVRELVAFSSERDVELIVRGAYAYNGYDAALFSSMTKLNREIDESGTRVLNHMNCLADTRGHFIDGGKYHVDGLHPSDAGHRVLYETALESPAFGGII